MIIASFDRFLRWLLPTTNTEDGTDEFLYSFFCEEEERLPMDNVWGHAHVDRYNFSAYRCQ